MKMFDSLLKLYVDEFHKDGEAALKAICNCDVPSKVILEKYDSLKIKLEDLPDHDKNELKAYIREMFPYKFHVEKMKAAKIVYTIGTVL